MVGRANERTGNAPKAEVGVCHSPSSKAQGARHLRYRSRFDPHIRWDNLENTHWDSMGRWAKVGHDKLLTMLVWVTPLLGTMAQRVKRTAQSAPGGVNHVD